MELHQVRYFLALCEEQNFTRAAKRCGISQPSLSNAIKRLEEELGGPLFYRNRVGCSLSELGLELRPYLAKLDETVADVRARATRCRTASRASVGTLPQATLGEPPKHSAKEMPSRVPTATASDDWQLEEPSCARITLSRSLQSSSSEPV
jgi:DNA-binding transcriptional LysR family regulator